MASGLPPAPKRRKLSGEQLRFLDSGGKDDFAAQMGAAQVSITSRGRHISVTLIPISPSIF